MEQLVNQPQQSEWVLHHALIDKAFSLYTRKLTPQNGARHDENLSMFKGEVALPVTDASTLGQNRHIRPAF